METPPTMDSDQEFQAQIRSLEEEYQRRLLSLKDELERERHKVKQLTMEAIQQTQAAQRQIAALQAQVAQSAMGGGQEGASDDAALLRARIAELESQLAAAGEAAIPADLQQYEAQLHEYRTQLEQAQQEIVAKEQALAQQEHAVHEKLKQTEIEMSKARADMGRQKAAVDRMRRDFRFELEHAQRELTVMNQLGAVQQLRGAGSRSAEVVAGELAKKLRDYLDRVGPA